MRKILVGMWVSVAIVNAVTAVKSAVTGADGVLIANPGAIALLSVLLAALNYRLGQYEEER